MSEPDSSDHKKEISRLNGIIDALISQNRALTAENAYLKNQNGLPQVISSDEKSEIGVNNVISSHQKNGKGISNTFSSHDKNKRGRNIIFSSDDKVKTGINNVNSSYQQSEIGINKARQPLPAFIEPAPDMISRLAKEINASGVKKVKRTGLRNMAVVLLQAHNQQSCSHLELRKLTGLSEGGIAKLIMSMKKRGLIYREGFGRFALSASARDMMEKASGVFLANR